MGVLPNRFGNNQWSLGVDVRKNLHPFFLRANKAMAFFLFVAMGTTKLVAAGPHGFRQSLLHFMLGSPAILIRRQTQITVGNQQDFFVSHRFDRFDLRQGVCGHRCKDSRG